MSRKPLVRRGNPPINMEAIAWDAMKKYGFRPQFENAVMQEVSAIEADDRALMRSGAEDLRALLWSSIDNYDSMDLDQMEYCEKEANGDIHVRVAIADVDSRVPKGSPIDKHAAYNGASIYLDVGCHRAPPVDGSQLIQTISRLTVEVCDVLHRTRGPP